MQIRIKQYTFTLSEPYAVGHALTPAEAQALNGLRAENIRNNMAKVVEGEVATLAAGKLLSKEQEDWLQGRIDEYSSKYQFVFRHIPAPRLGPIEREAEAIAEDRLRGRAGGEGLSLSEYNRLLRLEIDHPEVQEEARRRVAIRQDIAQSAIADLL